mmetsp:Transcript_21436/g.34508  ORF Transcript_21436/g.34508 Transcript_21436/m.34508 type:complete len:117 (-) Transcript_21436:138-488(-)
MGNLFFDLSKRCILNLSLIPLYLPAEQLCPLHTNKASWKSAATMLLSHSASVSAGKGCITSHADIIPPSDPVLQIEGAIICKQSSSGKRRNKPLNSARSSIDRIGPGLINGPRLKW